MLPSEDGVSVLAGAGAVRWVSCSCAGGDAGAEAEPPPFPGAPQAARESVRLRASSAGQIRFMKIVPF